MNLLVFGASGGTGRQTVIQALSQGHKVTAFVRGTHDFEGADARLRIVTGDATRDAAIVAQALEGQDAVVSALGRRNSLKSEHLIAQSMRLIAAAMERSPVRRLVVVSAFGVGATLKDAPLASRIFYRMLLKDILADKEVGDSHVRRSALDWTLVYPVHLTNGPITGRYRVGERLGLSGIPKVSRADVAHFVLREIEERAFLRKVAIISN